MAAGFRIDSLSTIIKHVLKLNRSNADRNGRFHSDGIVGVTITCEGTSRRNLRRLMNNSGMMKLTAIIPVKRKKGIFVYDRE